MLPEVWPDKWAETVDELEQQFRLIVGVNDLRKSPDSHIQHIGKTFKEVRRIRNLSLIDLGQKSGLDPLRLKLTEDGYDITQFESLSREEFIQAGHAMGVNLGNWPELLPKEPE